MFVKNRSTGLPETYALQMARLLQIDVKSQPNLLVRSQKFINSYFYLENSIF